MRPSSPIRMDPLSLARLFDAASGVPRLPPVEVRAVYDIRHQPAASSSSKPAAPKTPSPSKQASEALDLGTLHFNRRGELASNSEGGNENESPQARILSPPATAITPPTGSPLMRTPQASLKHGKRPMREPLQNINQEENLTCYTCTAKGRTPNIIWKDAVPICFTCRGSTFSEPVQGEKPTERRCDSGLFRESSQQQSHRLTTDEWQTEIKENYKEFETKNEGLATKGDDLDTTMHDAVDSDESSSFSLLEL